MIIPHPDDGAECGSIADIAAHLIEVGIVNGEQRIRDWKRRGLLTPVGFDGRQPYFRVADVMAVELRTRRTVTRRGGPERLTSDETHRTLIAVLGQLRPDSPASTPGFVMFRAGDP
jgi:hypothetical protein